MIGEGAAFPRADRAGEGGFHIRRAFSAKMTKFRLKTACISTKIETEKFM
jgi:hypothetical protein